MDPDLDVQGPARTRGGGSVARTSRRRFLAGGLGLGAASAGLWSTATEHAVPPSPVRLGGVPLAAPDATARPALVRRFPSLGWSPDNDAPVQLYAALADARPSIGGVERLGPDRLFVDAAAPSRRLIPWAPLFPRPVSTAPAPELARALGLDGLLVHDEGGPEPGAPCALALFGNKSRKYEYTLPAAVLAGARRVHTVASWGSNHAVALAAAARFAHLGPGLSAGPAGLAVRVQTYPQAVDPGVRAKQRYLRAPGAEVTELAGDVRAGAAIARHTLADGRFELDGASVFVPPGGSSPLAVLGHVDAALELAEALGDALPPEEVFVALGSGGTAVGLVLGFALLGWPTRVVATLSQGRPRWMGALLHGDPETPLAVGHARALAAEALLLLERMLPGHAALPAARAAAALGAERFVWDATTWPPDYGAASPAVAADVALAARAGLALDTTFAGKAFSNLCAWARAGRLRGRRTMFWNTALRFEPAAQLPELDAIPLPRLGGEAG